MRITELHVNGYRTLKDVCWEPGALNVVIGPNASGKSNLLKFLRLLSASARAGLNSQVLREGGMGAILWDGRGEGLSFSLTFDQPEQPKVQHFQYMASLRRLGRGASFAVDDEALMGWFSRNGIPEPGPSHLVRSQAEAFFHQPGAFTPVDPNELNPAETLLGQLGGPTPQAPEIKNFRQFLSNWSVYDDLHTESDTAIRRAVTARHDERLDADGQNLASVLHTHYTNDVDFKDRVDEAMRAAFGADYRGLAFPPAAGLSDGTLRFLCLLAVLAQPNPPGLIAWDEPETGLHPRMMRIVAELAEDAALRTQIVFTTHSAAFLDAFRKDSPPTTTVMELEDGQSRLRTVRPDDLSEWLQDYSLGALYRSRTLENLSEPLPEAEAARP